jgi:hypothetical protein
MASPQYTRQNCPVHNSATDGDSWSDASFPSLSMDIFHISQYVATSHNQILVLQYL